MPLVSKVLLHQKLLKSVTSSSIHIIDNVGDAL